MIPSPDGHDSTGAFAAEDATEEVAVAADPAVDDFRELNDAGNPEDQGEGHGQRHSHADKADAARTTVDPAISRDAVDGLKEILAANAGGDFSSPGVSDGDESDGIEPIEPCDDAHLEGAQRAVAVEEHGVAGRFVIHSGRLGAIRDCINAIFVRLAAGNFRSTGARAVHS